MRQVGEGKRGYKKAVGPLYAMTMCWLCMYNTTDEARVHQNFIADNAGTMDPHQRALEVSRSLLEQHPDAPGLDPHTVLEHITSHTLDPVCRISTMLRSLLRVSAELEGNLRKFDEEGNAEVDHKMVEVYLKVQSQIMAIYRQTDVTKLLFAHRSS